MKKFFRILGILLLVLGVVYAIGPRPKFEKTQPSIATFAVPLGQLDSYVAAKEQLAKLKPDNQARIVWADSVRQTEYALVYLHGFSATQEEGNPLHRDMAKRYGANLYLARMPMHGEVNPDAFEHMSPKALIEGAQEAIAIGKVLGKKVIVIGCSTGGTLGLYLAQNDPNIHALMLYSPNIDIADPASELLTAPWGQQLAKAVSGGMYHKWEADTAQQAYWSTSYRIEGLAAVKALVETTMVPATFAAVKQPVFMGYYFKDADHQDPVVSVDAMHTCFDQLGTPANQKRKVAFPDVAAHVICGRLFSKDIPSVEAQSYAWAEEILGLKPVQANK
jgi:pimeloyl-ACP methyl ester carboxylesterase